MNITYGDLKTIILTNGLKSMYSHSSTQILKTRLDFENN